MSKPLSILDQGEFDHYSVTEHGIAFSADTPRESWLEAVNQLCGMYEGTELAKQRTLMLLADALNWGMEKFGEEFAQAISATREHLGLSPKTIANAQWTYKRIEPARRVSGVTLGHYSVIASLDPKEQDRYIDQILTGKMTIGTLKEVVAEDHPKTKRGTSRKTSTETEATALQKAEDLIEWFDKNGVSPKFKIPLDIFYKLFRRHFIAKKGRR